MSDPLDTTQKPELPEIYYCDKRSKFYLPSDDGTWGEHTLQTVRSYLELMCGFEKHEISKLILEYQLNSRIALAGDYSGRQPGIVEFCYKKRFLVTNGPRIIEPKQGDWSVMKHFLWGFFGEEQLVYFLEWLKLSYQAFVEVKYKQAQALFLTSDSGTGKTMFLEVITELLGGRKASPFEYLTNGCKFNADLFAAEVLAMDDEVNKLDNRSRRGFASGIKKLVANRTSRHHEKNKTPIHAKIDPFWRVIVCFNSETEDMLTIPDRDPSVWEKFMLFRVNQMDYDPKANTEVKLMKSIPAFLYWLLNEWEAPKHVIEGGNAIRYGVKTYHDTTIFRDVEDPSSENQLLQLIDHHIFHGDGENGWETWSGTHLDLRDALCYDFNAKSDFDKVCWTQNKCGNLLKKLKSHPSKRVSVIGRPKGIAKWQILPPHCSN